MSDEPEPRANWLTILGWACYLACSWTWCIGMFLPVLLIRDYGIWGFVVFAVPNVLGAAAMGWAVRDQSQSGMLVAAHGSFMRLFSVVTVAFQVFFVCWLSATQCPQSGGILHAWLVPVLGLALLVSACFSLGRSFMRAPLRSGAFVLACSVGVGALILPVSLRAWHEPGPVTDSTFNAGLFGVATVSAFGFLLCPYLDLTFHRASQTIAASGARRAFGIGFGVLFLAMILLTLIYAPVIERAMRAVPVWGLALSLLSIHILLQLVFTAALHTRAVSSDGARPNKAHPGFALYGLSAVAGGLGVASTVLPHYNGMDFGEVTYRLFMAFYGLLFPAYVWLCMIPTWRSPRPPTCRHLAVWLVACALAAPAYWMGFIERVEWWLVPGLAVVLLARLFIPRADPAPDEPSGAPVPAPTHPPQLSGHAQPER